MQKTTFRFAELQERNCLIQLEFKCFAAQRDLSAKTEEKSNRLHQGRRPSEPFPTQIGPTERPRIVKGTMELNPNEFLCASL